jgi:hypothetical protein
MDSKIIKTLEKVKSSNRGMKILFNKILEEDRYFRELKMYVVNVISYNNQIPTFEQYFGVYYNAAEAVRDIAERKEIKPIENSEDPNNFEVGILNVSRVYEAEKKFTEKDLLASWKIILEHIEMRTEDIEGREVRLDNKYIILDALTDKYKIRKNNYLSNVYNKRNHKSGG